MHSVYSSQQMKLYKVKNTKLTQSLKKIILRNSCKDKKCDYLAQDVGKILNRNRKLK